MEFTLFTSLISEFYRLNRIPVFILKNGKTVFKTLSEETLSAKANAFLNSFGGSGITVYGDIECYAYFPYITNGEVFKIVIGPIFTAHPIAVGYNGGFAAEKIVSTDKLREFILSVSVTGEENFLGYISVLFEISGNGKFDYEKFKRKNISLETAIDKKLTEYVFETRENLLSPYAPDTERRILEMVKAGDSEGLKKISIAFEAETPGQRVPYLFKVVSLVALCTRAVLERGVDATTAYGLSDLYLEKLNAAETDSIIANIAKSVLPHFAALVSEKKENDGYKYSPHIAKAEKYIRSHLHYRITLKDAAEAAGVSEKYLSRLFITHKGEKFSSYTNRQRVNEAKDLILNTDCSLSEISYSVGFFSESYFIKVFGEYCSMTPNAFRRRYKNNK